MKRILILFLFSIVSSSVMADEGTRESERQIPFLFQIVPIFHDKNMTRVTDVNLGMIAANSERVNRVQFATGASFAERVRGLQFSGVLNHTDQLSGLQLSFGASFADSIKGLQLSGVLNHTKKLDGMQFATGASFAEKNNGLQLSGVLNWAEQLNGIQIGIFNKAGTGGGTQIGVFNISRDEKISSFGLFNYHKNSWMSIQTRTDTNGILYFVCQNGLGGFYSATSLGANPTNSDVKIHASLAVGYHLSNDLLFAELEGGFVKDDLLISDPALSAVFCLKGGVKLGSVFSIFSGVEVLAGREQNGFECVPGSDINLNPNLLIGMAVRVKGDS